eukprot:TRINITY_DN1216_c0_g3_i2.p1 TRINITY_DN1216_c0_g3~~TRINITY_DN1216_c0_g3_i2.p1  ORF type:complete len:667 (+),score=239.48 TRINITY_DN1216_c0_g3_i2:127-2127(+)
MPTGKAPERPPPSTPSDNSPSATPVSDAPAAPAEAGQRAVGQQHYDAVVALLGDSPRHGARQGSLLSKSDHLGLEDDEGSVEYKWKLVGVSEQRLEHLVTQMKYRVTEGQGECLYEIGVDNSGLPKGLAEDEYRESIDTVRRMAAQLKCDVSIVCEKVVSKQPLMRCCELMVRKMSEDECLDLRVAICGNVDSGKSTLVGVLTRGTLDNGRGSVRQSVFNHRHEIDTGRTSSVSQQIIGFDSQGRVVNYQEGSGASAHGHCMTNGAIAERSAKIVTLFDLAGHERYLRTTVFGMTGSVPDYAAIIVSANNGIQRMTKEHLGLCLALKIPVFCVVTRVDACPGEVAKHTLQEVQKILKMPGVRKLPYMVRSEDDAIICAKNIREDRVAPIFQVSNVTGMGLDLLKKFLNLIPIRRDWETLAKAQTECLLDRTFQVPGVGTVVSGIVTQGCISNGDTVLLGPDGHGHFRPVQIKGVHVRGVAVRRAEAGSTASFALKKEKKAAIRKGMVLLCRSVKPVAVWEFEAEVTVLFHSTTIHSNYQPVVHCRTIRQSARIRIESQEALRTGDRATVHFTFMFRPEYVTVGSKLIFREGRTKGLGTVTKVFHPVSKAPIPGQRDGMLLGPENSAAGAHEAAPRRRCGGVEGAAIPENVQGNRRRGSGLCDEGRK